MGVAAPVATNSLVLRSMIQGMGAGFTPMLAARCSWSVGPSKPTPGLVHHLGREEGQPATPRPRAYVIQRCQGFAGVAVDGLPSASLPARCRAGAWYRGSYHHFPMDPGAPADRRSTPGEYHQQIPSAEVRPSGATLRGGFAGASGKGASTCGFAHGLADALSARVAPAD